VIGSVSVELRRRPLRGFVVDRDLACGLDETGEAFAGGAVVVRTSPYRLP
jgi:hypothetical protein